MAPTPSSSERVFLASPVAGAGSGVIAAPFQFLMTGEDNLVVTAWADDPTLEIALAGRFLKTDGTILPFSYRVATVDTAAGRQTLLPLGPGFLLNLSLIAADASTVWGRLFARVDVVRGSIGARVVLGQMIGGYVTGASYLAWPGSGISNPWEGIGYLREITLPDPAAGVNLVHAPAAIARQQVVLVTAELTTDATVGTRRAALSITLPSGIAYGLSQGSAIPESTSAQPFVWLAGLGEANAVAGDTRAMPIPIDTWLFPGMVFTVGAVNFQPGDQWTDGRLLVRQWLSLP